MFAIELKEENLPEITQRLVFTDFSASTLDLFLRSRHEWYLITGYVDERGRYEEYAILPMFMLYNNFDYDIMKTHDKWFQIVRK